MVTIPRWGFRKVPTERQTEFEFIVAGIRGRLMWNPHFDKRGGGTRAVFSLSFDKENFHYDLTFQHYREGYDFNVHTDGVPENKVIAILLHRPRQGGEFFTEGDERVWLNGRVRLFDGGRNKHGVTRIDKGSRTVLMLQRGRWRL